MLHIQPDEWTPVGVDALEPAADEVVRLQENALVVAGPGAGKTELLAQRACYLLQTGLCQPPYRILAISFKRDAAKNLGERVEKRSGELASRFDSYTLDAFAKNIVDRFMLSLPAEWRPKIGYEVLVQSLRNEEIFEWFDRVGVPVGCRQINFRGLSNVQVRRYIEKAAHGEMLPYTHLEENHPIRHWGQTWWREQLTRPAGIPNISFPMLNRLAAFLLRENPKILKALRSTYSYVFLDEFQDTTDAQYDLVKAAFHESTPVLTAVGDSKQRIMLWAGAMENVFQIFSDDFQAGNYPLLSNYRSAPELVKMQHVIALALEEEAPQPRAARGDATGVCQVLEFNSPEDEAEYLAEWISTRIEEQELRPRDFCIIVRQRTADMIKPLQEALAAKEIKIRDESVLQDLLSEPITGLLLSIFRLSTKKRDAEAWEFLTNELAILFGLDNDIDSSRIESECKNLIDISKGGFATNTPVIDVIQSIVDTVGLASIRSIYRQYSVGSYLGSVMQSFAEIFQGMIDVLGSAQEAVSDFSGDNVVPAMTIHKSKGLEFNTVIFLGLEDSQWWNFSNQAEEEKRGFFVAFSRAIEHVYFTFCDVRDERWGRKTQGKNKIGDLFTILQQAGVSSVDFR